MAGVTTRSRSLSIRFYDGITAAEVGDYMHKLNLALQELSHGTVLQWNPPKKHLHLILECPVEALMIATAMERLPREIRKRVKIVRVFEDIEPTEEAA